MHSPPYIADTEREIEAIETKDKPADAWLGDQWYVVYCRPLKERHAVAALHSDLGLETYLPEIRRRKRGVEEDVPFFPGYFFLRVDLQQVRMVDILSAPGVVRLLGTFRPQPVPGDIVRYLSEQLNSDHNRLGAPSHPFKPGDSVWVARGPMRGIEAVFVETLSGGDRVKVLLELLGRMNEVKVEVASLELKSRATATFEEESQSHLPALPKRYTRGRGRKINVNQQATEVG